MKTNKIVPMDPFNLVCCFCKKPIESDDEVAVLHIPGDEEGRSTVAHIHHPGVKEEVVHPSQITTGEKLLDVAKKFEEEGPSNENV